MFNQSANPSYCVACRVVVPDGPSTRCSRCGADNRAWRAWLWAGWRTHLQRFLLRNPWGRLALVSLLLPVVSWAVFGFKPFAWDTVILLASLILSLAGLLFLFTRRDTLWTDELARHVLPHSRIGLLPLGGAGFIGFTVTVSILILKWGLAASRGEHPGTIEPASWEFIGLGIAFTAQTLAAGLYSVYAYGRWLARFLPPPIFWNEAKLLALVEQAVKSRLEFKTGWDKSTLPEIVFINRTEQAGLSLRLRSRTVTNKFFEGQFLTAVQYWGVVSDRWGHIRQFSEDGPLEYVPDPTRVYTPPTPDEPRQVLEGELIFPQKKQTRPTLEEAILTAISSNY